MKAILLHRKILRGRIDLSDPLVKEWYFHGNIMFRKGFTHKWFLWTGCCLHILGFRFTDNVCQKPFDRPWYKEHYRQLFGARRKEVSNG